VATEHFEIVQAGPSEVAIVSLDGEPKHLVLPNTTRAFWKTITKVDVERIDAATEVRVAKRHLDKLDPARSPMVVYGQVEAHEAGLLFVDGKLTERLSAGRHAFWAVGRTVKIQKVDTRPTPLEVTAQEILTSGSTTRVNAAACLQLVGQLSGELQTRSKRAQFAKRSAAPLSAPSPALVRRRDLNQRWAKQPHDFRRCAASGAVERFFLSRPDDRLHWLAADQPRRSPLSRRPVRRGAPCGRTRAHDETYWWSALGAAAQNARWCRRCDHPIRR
jgi:hypothetical protein